MMCGPPSWSCVVDLLAEELVERLEAGENHRALHHLDVALAQTVEVSADPDAPPRDVAEREGLVVRPARLAGDHATALQVLHADAALDGREVEPHDRVENVPDLAIDRDFMALNRLGREALLRF